MTDPLTTVNLRHTPQSQPADSRQVRNNAGGHTFVLDDMARLRRFLTLGVDKPTYYASAAQLTADNAPVVLELARTRSHEMVAEIVTISTEGRAPRQQPALFALAAASSLSDVEGRQFALDAVPAVCRTGTHLFQFVQYVEQFRGWGPALRRAVANWYLDQPVADVAHQVVKYRQRLGWTHRDVLRLSHPKVTGTGEETGDRRALFDWICGRWPEDMIWLEHPPLYRLDGFRQAQRASDPMHWADLVHEFRLTWEMLPDAALGHAVVWDALLTNGLPATALMRQLPRLTRLGMLHPIATWTNRVAEQLADPERLRAGRVHPMSVLLAAKTYAQGHGEDGKSRWTPSAPIVDALDRAFYNAFGAVEPTGARILLALDISGSMGSHIPDLARSTPRQTRCYPITCREASAALALVTAAVEPRCTIVGFSGGPGTRATNAPAIMPLAISPRQRLDDVVRMTERLPMAGTDCALPMLYALEKGLAVDTFVVYTDNETWAGAIHPHQALRRYRERTGINAKLVVVGMTATGFTIADPDDAGMLDVAGFDAAVPGLISDFARGL